MLTHEGKDEETIARIKSSEDDDEEELESNEEDDQSTSSDEEIDPKIAKLMQQVEENIKRINAKIDHPISLKELIKTTNHIKKKNRIKNKREIRGRAKALTSIGIWVSNDEDSSSSDEGITIHSSKKSSSSRSSSHKSSSRKSCHKCLMAKGMDSDVSDDESDENSPSYDDILHLINEQQMTLKKQ